MTIEFVCLEDLIEPVITEKRFLQSENLDWKSNTYQLISTARRSYDEVVQIFIGLPIEVWNRDIRGTEKITHVPTDSQMFGIKLKELSQTLVKRCQELTGLTDHNFVLCITKKGIPLLGAFK